LSGENSDGNTLKKAKGVGKDMVDGTDRPLAEIIVKEEPMVKAEDS